MTVQPLPVGPLPAARGRWRLHPAVEVVQTGGTGPAGDLDLRLGARVWRLRAVDPRLVGWLRHLGSAWATPPEWVSGDPACRKVVDRLRADSVLLRDDPLDVLLVEPSGSGLEGSLAPHARVRHHLTGRRRFPRLPTRAELEAHEGLVVIHGAAVDHTLSWLVRRSGLDQVVITTSSGGCRVGWFPADGPCTLCELDTAAERLLATSLPPPPILESRSVPAWMDEWVRSQVVLLLRQRSGGGSPARGWRWLSSSADSGFEPARQQRECCGAGLALAG